jgi:hypothetical protein
LRAKILALLAACVLTVGLFIAFGGHHDAATSAGVPSGPLASAASSPTLPVAPSIAPTAGLSSGGQTATAARGGTPAAPSTTGSPTPPAPKAGKPRSAQPPTTGIAPQLSDLVQPGATSVPVVLGGNTAALEAAVRVAGGSVLASVPNRVSAVIPTAKIAQLAATKAITSVSKPVKAYAQSDEGTVASQVAAWNTNGQAGAGVIVAIVDGGFGGLATAATAGLVPAGQTVREDDCQDRDATSHGTSVATIVHEMAPAATLYLYCVDDNIGFESAAANLTRDGAKIANASLALPGDARGDGSGGPDSAATAVRNSRLAGVLWTVASGNYAANHWSGNLVDSNNDGAVDLRDATAFYDGVKVDPGEADIMLQYDVWPTSSRDVALFTFGYQCDSSGVCSQPIAPGAWHETDQVRGGAPVIDYQINNTSGYPQIWYVYVGVGVSMPTTHYDLTYFGAADGAASNFASIQPQLAAQGSVTSPANSPYAFAVGAVDASGANACGSDTTLVGTYPLEGFSGRGSTIDGRVKPDIVAYDGVNSHQSGVPAICGTSFAAPYVAGAAAVLAGANSALRAWQLQALLQQRASAGTPVNPATNTAGSGFLSLGTPPTLISPLGRPTGPTRSDVVATSPDGRLWYYQNNGTANPFTTVAVVGSGGWQNFNRIVLGDIDGDGLADLVTTSPDGRLWYYQNTGTITPYATPVIIGAGGWQNFNRIMLADVNGDGRADILATSPDGRLWFYANSGSPASPFGAPIIVGSGGWQNFNQLVAGDVSGDGKADIVATSPDGKLWYYANGGSATAPYVTVAIIGSGGWQNFNRFALADVDGDAKADLVTTSPDGRLWYYHNGGALPPFSVPSIIGDGGWQNFDKLA